MEAQAPPYELSGIRCEVVPPRTSHRSGSPKLFHLVELFLDFCCPHSAKMFDCLFNHVFPAMRENATSKSNVVNFIIRQQVQPWHPSSTLMHEAAIAVLIMAPEKYWLFCAALFQEQKEYFDVKVVNETRNQTYRRLARLAASKIGVNEQNMYDLLKVPETATPAGNNNAGNAVTTTLKKVVQLNRLTEVQVTPTVLKDDVFHKDLGSGTSVEAWLGWAREYCR